MSRLVLALASARMGLRFELVGWWAGDSVTELVTGLGMPLDFQWVAPMVTESLPDLVTG